MPRFLNLAETLLMEPTAAPARVMFRENLAAKVPFWEETRQAAQAAQEAGEVVTRETTGDGPLEDAQPSWWEPDEVVAARQRLMAVRSHGAASPLED